MSPVKAFLVTVTVFLFLTFPFDPFLKFPFLCLHYTSVLACYLLFKWRYRHINHSYFWFPVWSFQHLCPIWVWFWCLLCLSRLFLFAFGHTLNFFVEIRTCCMYVYVQHIHTYVVCMYVIETEENRSSVWAFLLVWLEEGLCLMSALTVGPRGFKFFWCPCFCLLLIFGFPKNSSSERVVSVTLAVS